MLRRKVTGNFLAFDENPNFTTIHDGVVNLFAALGTNIRRELGYDLLRIEDVIAENS